MGIFWFLVLILIYSFSNTFSFAKEVEVNVLCSNIVASEWVKKHGHEPRNQKEAIHLNNLIIEICEASNFKKKPRYNSNSTKYNKLKSRNDPNYILYERCTKEVDKRIERVERSINGLEINHPPNYESAKVSLTRTIQKLYILRGNCSAYLNSENIESHNYKENEKPSQNTGLIEKSYTKEVDAQKKPGTNRNHGKKNVYDKFCKWTDENGVIHVESGTKCKPMQ